MLWIKKIAFVAIAAAVIVGTMPTDSLARSGHGGSRGGHGGFSSGGNHGGSFRGGHRSGGNHGYRSSRNHGFRGGHGGYRKSGRHYGGHGHRYSYARPYYGGYGYYNYGGYWVPYAILGGAALTYAVVNSNNQNYAAENTQPAQATQPCNIVHREELNEGRRVKMGATMCYDTRGIAYIVRNSEHIVEYLD